MVPYEALLVVVMAAEEGNEESRFHGRRRLVLKR